jgi:hypothetical protein
MCLGLVNSSVEFDTGLIDSRDDFGINVDDSNRVQFPKAITCTPITGQRYIENGSTSYNSMVFNYSAAFYGPNRNQHREGMRVSVSEVPNIY